MATRDQFKAEIDRLRAEGLALIDDLIGDVKKAHIKFVPKYQTWYTESLQIVRTFAPDRLPEFRACYEIDPKRSGFSDTNYVIQDFIRGVSPRRNPSTGKPYFDAINVLRIRLFTQVTLLDSIRTRVDGLLANVQTALAAELEDSALSVAERLIKISPRAAGALAGVVVEAHLQRLAVNRSVKIGKKNPTIADLNDPLRAASVYDTPVWRRVQYLADLRNLCSHKKEREPTSDEARELVKGAEWLVKNTV